jgi:hypothetical protein
MRKSTILLSSYCLLSGVAFAGAFDPLPMPTQTVSGRQVIINVPQTRLFVLENGKLTHVFPIAVGKSLTKTPLGEYKVTDIRRNPTWFVPASIQAEMRQSGKNVETAVPPGPGNPLGPVFIRFGDPALGLGMHGTNHHLVLDKTVRADIAVTANPCPGQHHAKLPDLAMRANLARLHIRQRVNKIRERFNSIHRHDLGSGFPRTGRVVNWPSYAEPATGSNHPARRMVTCSTPPSS